MSATRGLACVVYPSGPEIPQSLLRIVLDFDTPVHTPIFDRICLRYDNGTPALYAFVQQELWSPDQRTLTLLLHPSRVKTGLVGHETLGHALRPGEGISLELDGQVVKRWQVVSRRWAAPAPEGWAMHPITVNTRAPLRIDLGDPIDVLSRDLIRVTDGRQAVPGRTLLSPGERWWRFRPDQPWADRTLYQVMVHPRLENPCGDQVGEPLEHTAGTGLGSRRRSTALTVTTT